jgi:hypothetical protein
MSVPTMIVLGVHRPVIPKRVYKEQWRVTGSDELTRLHFDNLFLFEAVITHNKDQFKTRDLGQFASVSGCPDHFQCAWDEALLSLDGETVIAKSKRTIHCLERPGTLRSTFYLHFYDPERPLRWSFGEIKCPHTTPLPKRLRLLVPYTPCT